MEIRKIMIGGESRVQSAIRILRHEKVLKSYDLRAFSLFFSLFVVNRVVVDPYFDPYRSIELGAYGSYGTRFGKKIRIYSYRIDK